MCYNDDGYVCAELQKCHRRLHFDIHDKEALANVSCLAGDEIECKKHAISQCNDDNVINDDLICTDFHLEEISYSSGKEAELLYVRDVLLASGVIGERTLLTSFHVPHQLVNSNLFEKMENNYLAKESKLLNPDRTIGAMLSPSQRRLLFDSVNEILYVLGHRLTSSKLTTSDIDIFKHVSLHIDQLLCSHSDSQYTLENLVMNDVGKKGQWFDNGLEVEALGLEMERMIIDDLIEDLLLDF